MRDASDNSAATEKLDEEHNQCHDQQQMNQAAADTTDGAQQPQDQQNH
jgi:hypothetical protein